MYTGRRATVAAVWAEIKMNISGTHGDGAYGSPLQHLRAAFSCAEFHQGCAKAPNAGANIWTDKYQTEARGRTHISTCVSQAEGYDRMYSEIPFDPDESYLPKEQQNKS